MVTRKRPLSTEVGLSGSAGLLLRLPAEGIARDFEIARHHGLQQTCLANKSFAHFSAGWAAGKHRTKAVEVRGGAWFSSWSMM